MGPHVEAFGAKPCHGACRVRVRGQHGRRLDAAPRQAPGRATPRAVRPLRPPPGLSTSTSSITRMTTPDDVAETSPYAARRTRPRPRMTRRSACGRLDETKRQRINGSASGKGNDAVSKNPREQRRAAPPRVALWLDSGEYGIGNDLVPRIAGDRVRGARQPERREAVR